MLNCSGKLVSGFFRCLCALGRPANCTVYETWINQHAPDQSETLTTLAEQRSLVVHLYIDDGRLGRTLVLINEIQNCWRQALAEIAARPPWSMQEFDQAREQLYRQYAEPWDLWQQIGRETA